MKSLTMAQLATASMGKFDKKLKKEPDAPKTQRLVKKKSNKALGELESNRGNEKSRNLKIFDFMQRKAEQGEANAVAKAPKKASAGKNRRPSSKGPAKGIADQGKKIKKGGHKTVKK